MSVINDILKKASVMHEETLTAQDVNGLNVNMSGVYTEMIKDAARCNGYSSDVIYDINAIDKELKNYDSSVPAGPFLVAFRKLGVDNNDFIGYRCKEWTDIYREYFALHSVEIIYDEPGWAKIIYKKYCI